MIQPGGFFNATQEPNGRYADTCVRIIETLHIKSSALSQDLT